MTTLADIAKLVESQRGKPPIEKWQPELSGDIDIRIAANGDWFHEGDKIERHALVVLFASILRREADGEYYLVTPVEKWRIAVEDLPLTIVLMEQADGEIALKTNTNEWLRLSNEHNLSMGGGATDSPSSEPKPEVSLWHGLKARINRNVFYQLVDIAEQKDGELVLYSCEQSFSLGKFE